MFDMKLKAWKGGSLLKLKGVFLAENTAGQGPQAERKVYLRGTKRRPVWLEYSEQGREQRGMSMEREGEAALS